jgi:aminopeptidase-like protein
MQKKILERLFPLHRTLVSDGTDAALEIIGEYMPECSSYSIETFPPLEDAWTWKVPERYVVREAYLETEDGRRIADFSVHPLHRVSYSVPVDAWLSWDELVPHLFYSEKKPHAIPLMFRYYQRDWGFCISKNAFDALPRSIRYHAVIHSEFVTDPAQGLRVSTGVISTEGGPSENAGEILLCAHICHPYQANDDLAGVVNCIEIAVSHQISSPRVPPVCDFYSVLRPLAVSAI